MRIVRRELGQLALHDVYLAHGSTVIFAGCRYAGIATRYMSSTSVFRQNLDMSLKSRFDWNIPPNIHLRGENRQLENDFKARHPLEQ